MNKNYVGNQIKKIRLLKNLTQNDIGKKSDISQMMIGQYEAGYRMPKNDSLQKIADALGVDAYALKDLDIDVDNREAIKQLFFQLEERGLFSIKNLTPRLDYVDGKPHYTLAVPIDEETAIMCRTWAQLKDGAQPVNKKIYNKLAEKSRKSKASENLNKGTLLNWRKIDLDQWKFEKAVMHELDDWTENLDLKPTSELLSLDLLTFDEMKERLEMGWYTKEDLERIRKLFTGEEKLSEDEYNHYLSQSEQKK